MRLLLRGRASATRIALAIALGAMSVAGFRAPALAVGGVTGTIQGTVTDASTHAPIANVAVTAIAPSQSSRAITDAKGFYSFAGLPIDTYTISFTLNGYETYSAQGVTVQGDQQVSVGATLTRSLQRIGRTGARSAVQAFQPKQTVDSYQISGQQAANALGRSFNVSQTQLQSSVPSITTTFYGSSSIRGSTRTEIAYQFDGIDYTDPLSSQFQNSLGLNGIQSLQVNPGAGDATQGNAGAGAVNIVVKRGARPSFGSVQLDELAYPFTHQGSGEYGWATPNGRISNYTSYIGINQDRIYGASGIPAYVNGTAFTVGSTATRDFINNFVYKFGHDNSRSLQFLYQTRYTDFIFNRGGIDNLCYKTCDPIIAGTPTATGSLTGGTYFNGSATTGIPQANRFADFQQIVGLLPGQHNPNEKLYYRGFNHQPVDVLKFEYAQQLSPTTFWTNRLYRVIGNAVFNRPYDSQSTTTRTNLAQGGVRTGLSGELVKQFGDKHQVTLAYVYQGAQPVFDYVSDTLAYRSLTPAITAHAYELVDFIPGTGFACPKADPLGTALVNNASTGNGCGYLGQFFSGGIPRIPNLRNESSGYQHLFGVGIRDVFNVSQRLRLDFGVRLDGSDYQLINDPGAVVTNEARHPRVTEPRFAAAYQLGARDAVRFSYGRSVQFTPAGNLNSPIAFANEFGGIPSRDSRTGLPAKSCGPPLFTSVCTDYRQQLHDEYVNFFGLEGFNVKPATFSNFDASYSHQFKGNVGLKVSPFFKRGYDVNVFTTPVIGFDSVLSLPIFGPTTLSNAGVDKTTGVELQVTKDAPIGFSGFFAATYVNRLQNVPPLFNATEDFYPSIPPAALALGNLYRAGYLSPFNARLGVAYKTRSGFRVNPIVFYDKGFPQIGAGTLTAAFINNNASIIPNTNVGAVGGGSIANTGSSTGVTQYVSPTNPGSVFNPNVVATRGTPETSLAGGVLTKARTTADLDFEFSRPGSRNTFGLYVTNLFNLTYSEPSLNTRYQPVATGIAGPQTGQLSQANNPLGGPSLFYYNFGPERFGQRAYTFNPSNAPISFRFYFNHQL